jgi:thymidylate synthase
MTPRYLKGSLGNTHIYLNHVDQVALQLTREPRKLPTLTIPDENFSIFTWTHGQYKLEGYDPHPFIKAPVAV